MSKSRLSPLGAEIQLRDPALDFLLINLIAAQLEHHANVPQMTVRSRVSIVLELSDDYVLRWGERNGAVIEFEAPAQVERPLVKRVGAADIYVGPQCGITVDDVEVTVTLTTGLLTKRVKRGYIERLRIEGV